MVYNRFAHHLRSAKDFGQNLYHRAHRLGSAVDKGMRFAKQAYGVFAPALRELGVNTGQAGRVADRAFTGYSQLTDRVVRSNDVLGAPRGSSRGAGAKTP